MQKYKVYVNNNLKIVEENWSKFCSNYIIIEAAGGVVLNSNNQILMIYKNGKWDLPKGKLEKGESKFCCAIREVKEETGISELNIVHKLQNTYHTYILNMDNILKITYWYKMKGSDDKLLIPDTKEGISRVCWVNIKDISDKLKNSYGNIKDLLINI